MVRLNSTVTLTILKAVEVPMQCQPKQEIFEHRNKEQGLNVTVYCTLQNLYMVGYFIPSA